MKPIDLRYRGCCRAMSVTRTIRVATQPRTIGVRARRSLAHLSGSLKGLFITTFDGDPRDDGRGSGGPLCIRFISLWVVGGGTRIFRRKIWTPIDRTGISWCQCCFARRNRLECTLSVHNRLQGNDAHLREMAAFQTNNPSRAAVARNSIRSSSSSVSRKSTIV